MTRTAWGLVLLVVLAALAAGLYLWRAEGKAPRIEGLQDVVVGREPATVAFEVADDGSGLQSLRVVLVHAGGEALLEQRGFPGDLLLGGGPARERVEVTIDAKALGLRDGDAFLRVEARDWSWADRLRGNPVSAQVPVSIDTHPPRVSIGSGLTYVRRGGSAVVVYRLSEPTERDGVMVDDHFYAGVPWSQPAPGCATADGGTDPGCRVALWAVPVDAAAKPDIRVVAEDAAGNRAEARWATRVLDRTQADVPIRLPQSFLDGKVVELSEAWGIDDSDRIAAFRTINEQHRAADEQHIRDQLATTSRTPLWKGAFEQLANSKVTSLFAEKRRYLVDGKQVSRATHYGYDLASTAGAPITASNAGRVIFADAMGIYGNCVLLDHGLGLVSLYGHLSRIDVKPGEDVAKGQVLGISDSTGLAGGDHLHFALLVGDTYVDPVEWWDAQWVRDHVTAQLGAPPGPGGSAEAAQPAGTPAP